MINNFDKEKFLEANNEIKELLEKKEFKTLEEYLEKIGLEEIKKGIRKFHPEFEPFDEEKYVNMNEDIKEAIQNGKLKSGWEHFINYGYEELIKNNPNRKFIKSEEIYAAIDYIFYLDKEHLFINGWAYSLKSDKIDLFIEDKKAEIFNYERPDLSSIAGNKYKTAGFVGIVKCNQDKNKIEVEFVSESGNSKIIIKELQNLLPKEKSKIVLNFINLNSSDFVKLFDIVGEPLRNMWNEYYSSLDLNIKITEYGNLPENPKLSIIVPLYGRVDFIEFQNAVFSTDKDFLENVELIYVLDDPDRFLKDIYNICERVYSIYDVPMKLITYDYNLGYARANNVGVKYASADMILLLNSDVFPKTKGWVSEILNKYKQLTNPGVLGFKLLYEDESIQHVGMKFKKEKHLGNMWINYHPFKGMPDIDKKEKIEEKEAVTGACMLIEKKKYFEVGGFSENYVLGDFEDSDLCLKLKNKGYKIYYSSKPEFYHLERQSQNLFDDTNWKFKITVFNCWQQMKKWGSIIKGNK